MPPAAARKHSMPTKNLLEGLTTEQQAAVTHLYEPCLVIAGAGTGKTTVLTRRIAYLIQEQKIEPEHIVALTFTEKAAREMEERVDQLLPYGVTGTTIATFHSFAAELVRRHALLLGMNPEARLLTPSEEMSFLRSHLSELPTHYLKPHRNPLEFLRTVTNFMSRAQDEFISPEVLIATTQTRLKNASTEAEKESAELLKEMSTIYQKAQALYAEEDVISYGRLLYLALMLLKDFPSVRATEQERIQFLLIDEFQDTNTVQNALTEQLTSGNRNIQVVGDDDQAIYRFRGANIQNILHFSTRYPDRTVITLNDNYRSTQPILNAAYQLIQYNNPHRLEIQEKVSKKLLSHLPGGEEPVHWHFSQGFFEYEAIAKEAQRLITAEEYQPEEIAILVRARTHLKNLETALKAEGIAYQLSGDSTFYQLEPVKVALSYLRFLINPFDDLTLYFTLSHPPFSVNPDTLQKALHAAGYEKISFYEYLGLHEPTLEALIYLQEQLKNNSSQLLPSQVLASYLTSSGWYSKLQEQEEHVTAEILSSLYQEVRSFEETNSQTTLLAYINHLDLLLATEEEVSLGQGSNPTRQGVQVMTIHKSKGLEFRAVFIPHMVQGRFPSRNSTDSWVLPAELLSYEENSSHLEEERRLAYVAMTRAKERLYFTSSEQYEERKLKSKLSPFLTESLNESVEAPITLARPSIFTPPSTKHASPEYQPGKEYGASALATYQDCPQKYYYQEVLKISVPNSHFSNFGISMHETLKEWFMAKKRGETPDIITLYADSWRTGGYEHKAHEKEMYTSGLEALTKYLDSCQNIEPVGLEINCRANLTNGTVLKGRIDRIDKEGESITIIDYKTGISVKKAKEWQEDIPLFTYLLALEQRGEVVKEIQLHYVMAGEKVIIPKEQVNLTSIENEVQNLTQAIHYGVFTAKPDKIKCSFCEYRTICPFRYGNP